MSSTSIDMRSGAAVGIRYAVPMFDEDAVQQKLFRFKPRSPDTWAPYRDSSQYPVCALP